MKRTLIPAFFATFSVMATLTSVGCLHRHYDAACEQRSDAYLARVAKLKRDASETLQIGTTKDTVIRFFENNGIPVTFVGGEASGTIFLKGCAPFGCGSDDALLGLRVKVDKAGTVISEPVVGAIYTNCL